jgi:hypothetical protein
MAHFKLFEEFATDSEESIVRGVLDKASAFLKSLGLKVTNVDPQKGTISFEAGFSEWSYRYEWSRKGGQKTGSNRSWFLGYTGSLHPAQKMSFLSFKKIVELVIEQAKHISTINELVILLGYKGFTNIERVFQILEEDRSASVDTDVYYGNLASPLHGLQACQFTAVPKDMIILRFDMPSKDYFDHNSHKGREQNWAGYVKPFTDNILLELMKYAKFENESAKEIIEKYADSPLGSCLPELRHELRGQTAKRKFAM